MRARPARMLVVALSLGAASCGALSPTGPTPGETKASLARISEVVHEGASVEVCRQKLLEEGFEEHDHPHGKLWFFGLERHEWTGKSGIEVELDVEGDAVKTATIEEYYLGL